MSETVESSQELGRLLVLAKSPNKPGDGFRECRCLDPESEQAAEAACEFAPNCIRADATGATLAIRVGNELSVPTVIDDDASPDALAAADCVIARNEFRAEQCIARGADAAKVVTLYERIDRDLFRPEGEAAPGGEGRPRLLSVAHDNVATMLKACRIASKKHEALRLVHIGDGEWIEQPFAERHRNAPDLPAWYRWADALLMPSKGDPGPVPAQALACGTPCIVSDVEAMREFVTDRWDGLLVKPDDPDDIAQAIDRIADPGTQARFAAPARTASERFDATAIDRRESGIYRWLLRKESPLVSVVIPTFNREKLVAAAIENVLSQDYPALELIVVNDGSTDGTRAELDRIEASLQDSRLRVIHQQNQKLPGALNCGFAQATGVYWTWTSDDNRYRPGALAAMARELELQPEAGLVYANMVKHLQSGKDQLVRMGPPEALSEGCVVGACFMYRASIARAVGEYDATAFLAEDYDYWFRFRRHAPLMWLRRTLYDYADTTDSLSRVHFVEAQRARLRLLEREFGDTPDWEARKFARYCADASDSKNAGLALSAARSALRAIRMRPGSRTGWRTLARALTPAPLLRVTRRMRGLDDG